MYQNLRTEMARHNLTSAKIAAGLGIRERNFRNRMNGSTLFTIPEAFAVRDRFFPGMSIDYLFDNAEAPTD